MRTNEQGLLDHIAAHAGLPEIDQARRAATAVLWTFGAALSPPARDRVADELSGALAIALRAGRDREPNRSIQDRVASMLGRSHVQATEIIAAVCHVLAEELSEDAVGELRRWLPRDIAAFLASSEEVPARRPAGGRTLAEGRPGSRHPLSDARPPPRIQSGSVAASPDPHVDTRLSTSPGTTQEREHETLAEGHPGPERPLSRGR